MERMVTLILIILVVLVGFFVVKKIVDASNAAPTIGNEARCITLGGTCTAGCDGEVIADASCAEGRVCCGTAS